MIAFIYLLYFFLCKRHICRVEYSLVSFTVQELCMYVFIYIVRQSIHVMSVHLSSYELMETEITRNNQNKINDTGCKIFTIPQVYWNMKTFLVSSISVFCLVTWDEAGIHFWVTDYVSSSSPLLFIHLCTSVLPRGDYSVFRSLVDIQSCTFTWRRGIEGSSTAQHSNSSCRCMCVSHY